VARGYRTIKIELPKRGESAAVYTSARVADALREITADVSLYHGVRLVQVMEAVYLQGKKDGAREAFEEMDRGMAAVKVLVPHGRPGRPRRTAPRKPVRRKAARKAASRKATRRK
jgi:hypothetical protein